MTDAEVLALVRSNATAKALATKRLDAECAEVLRQIAPPVPVAGRFVDERSLYAAFPAKPAEAEAILQGLDAIGESNPVVKRVRGWLSPEKQGIDLGNATVRAFIQQLAAEASEVFTAERVAVLLAMGEAKPTISTDDVSRVLADAKANGITL